jgi:hypothetical protein
LSSDLPNRKAGLSPLFIGPAFLSSFLKQAEERRNQYSVFVTAITLMIGLRGKPAAMKNLLTVLLLVACLLTASSPGALASQVSYDHPYRSPYGLAIDQYQTPDGKYDSQVAFIRSLNGTPCGLQCSQRAAARWGFGR